MEIFLPTIKLFSDATPGLESESNDTQELTQNVIPSTKTQESRETQEETCISGNCVVIIVKMHKNPLQ
jgi:hypothetical protein